MFQCEDQGVPCLTNDYYKFDDICRSELAHPISVDEIINHSDFCISIAIDIIDEAEGDDDFLSLNEYLEGIKEKVGIYHLWIEIGDCQDHEKHSLLCVYVGKGYVKNRVLSHIKEKWPREHMLYISFYECKNRIAKYLEQLFLDSYDFYLNKGENIGSGSLYARWDEYRFINGTEVHTMANILSNKQENT